MMARGAAVPSTKDSAFFAICDWPFALLLRESSSILSAQIHVSETSSVRDIIYLGNILDIL
jgi:hypothetical protein